VGVRAGYSPAGITLFAGVRCYPRRENQVNEIARAVETPRSVGASPTTHLSEYDRNLLVQPLQIANNQI